MINQNKAIPEFPFLRFAINFPPWQLNYIFFRSWTNYILHELLHLYNWDFIIFINWLYTVIYSFWHIFRIRLTGNTGWSTKQQWLIDQAKHVQTLWLTCWNRSWIYFYWHKLDTSHYVVHVSTHSTFSWAVGSVNKRAKVNLNLPQSHWLSHNVFSLYLYLMWLSSLNPYWQRSGRSENNNLWSLLLKTWKTLSRMSWMEYL